MYYFNLVPYGVSKLNEIVSLIDRWDSCACVLYLFIYLIAFFVTSYRTAFNNNTCGRATESQLLLNHQSYSCKRQVFLAKSTCHSDLPLRNWCIESNFTYSSINYLKQTSVGHYKTLYVPNMPCTNIAWSSASVDFTFLLNSRRCEFDTY